MTLDELYAVLSELGIPVAYMHFKEKQTPPFMQYAFPNRNDFPADNLHYYPVKEGWAEIYHDNTAGLLKLETRLERILDQYKIPWDKVNEDYISDEKLVYARYKITIIGGQDYE